MEWIPILLQYLRMLGIRLMLWYAFQSREKLLRWFGFAFLAVLACMGWSLIVLVPMGFVLWILTQSKDDE